MLQKFWQWYERHYLLNIGIALSLFFLQIVHLVWLALDVMATKAFGYSFLNLTPLIEHLLVFVDFTEIPALISVSLIYIHDMKTGWTAKALLYLLFLNLQWLHLFWITDEFIISSFRDAIVPPLLAWFAIAIDYLEIPVIIDTVKKFVTAVKKRRAVAFLKKDFRKE